MRLVFSGLHNAAFPAHLDPSHPLKPRLSQIAFVTLAALNAPQIKADLFLPFRGQSLRPNGASEWMYMSSVEVS